MTNEHGPVRVSKRTTFLAALMLAAVWELVYLELFQPQAVEFLEMNLLFAAALGSGLLVQWLQQPSTKSSKAVAVALCLALSSVGAGTATAAVGLSEEPELPESYPDWDELGLGDDFPVGATNNLGGLPCWQLRMSDDIEGLVRYFWSTVTGSAISTGVYILNTAEAAGGVGATLSTAAGVQAAAVPALGSLVAYVSWNALMEEGCGGCGEEGSLSDWELGQCGPFKIDCCRPNHPWSPGREDQPQEQDEEDPDHAELADGGRDPDLPTTPALEDTSSGFAGVKDLVDFGWLGGDGRPDPTPEDCIDLFGAQCNSMCPPAGGGMCVNSCNTCGGCVYTSCN